MIFAALLQVAIQSPPEIRCRLDDGHELPCDIGSFRRAARHGRLPAATTIEQGHGYDQENHLLTLACYRVSSGTCHFRIEEAGVQRRVRLRAGHTTVLSRVGWNARLCGDPRNVAGICHGEPVTSGRQSLSPPRPA